MDEMFLPVEDHHASTEWRSRDRIKNRLHRKEISGKRLSSFSYKICPHFWNTNIDVLLIERTEGSIQFYPNIIERWRGGSVKAGFLEKSSGVELTDQIQRWERVLETGSECFRIKISSSSDS